jgi:hypothetical protein
MSRLLILVHGMGSNPPKWSEPLLQKLDAIAAQYSAFRQGAPFSQRCTIAEVRYDGVFERYLEEWNASATEFAKFQKKQKLPLPGLVKWLTDDTLPKDQQNVFWSTLLDTILYRGFPVVRDEVRAVAMSQIVGHCTANMRAGSLKVSILAHSLGTAVVHDTLQLLASGPQLGNDSFTAKKGWHFENLFMLADVARLGPPALLDLKDSAKTYLVRPRSAGTPGNPATFYCNAMYSFRHELDPFVRWNPFVPAGWGEDFISPSPLPAIHAANVHSFTHYLSNPSVHIPIINQTLGSSVISTKEALDAIGAYPALGTFACGGQIAELKQLVADIDHAGDDLEEIAIRGSRFFATVQRLAVECRELAGDLGA